MFDDVVVTNNPKLIKTIFLWSHALRLSARREKKYPGSISNQLKKYQDVLKTMKFTFPDNDTLVDAIIQDLVKQFEENWNEETQRQKDMAKRASEILLRWGSFSEDYVERAELLCDLPEEKITTKRVSLWVLILVVGVIAPAISIVPFTFALEGEGVDPSTDKVGLIVSPVWLGCILGYVDILCVFHLVSLSIETSI